LKYRSEIDGLRALAVVPVILFHADFELFSGGFVGVDVFFVISGYLITTILIEDIENKRFSIVNFYERRARRILPALFFVMLVCIPFSWMLMLPSQMKDFSQSLIAVSLFSSNILFWRDSGYFEAAADEKPLLHTWSLAVEEQYYLLFPIFLIIAWRFGKNRVFWMIVVMAAVSLLLSEWGWRNKATANFYLAPPRAWELFAGSIAAFVVQKRGVQKSNPLALLGLAAIVFSIFAYDESTPFPSVYALVPVLGTVLLVLFADKDTLAARFLSAKVLVGLGLISYSAYLWHHPLFAFSRISSVESPSVLVSSFLSVASIALAYFTWTYIEKPTRDKLVFKRKGIFSLSIFGILIFSVSGLLGQKTEGFESSLLNKSELIVWHSLKRSLETDCDKGVSECIKILDVKGEKNILLIGDSNAYHFSKGLKETADEFNYTYVQLTMGGCMPLADFYRIDESQGFNKKCISFNESIREEIFKLSNDIDVVVISSAWLLYYGGTKLFNGIGNERGIQNVSKLKISLDGIAEVPYEKRKQVFDSYFDDIFGVLKSKAKDIIVVGPMPPAVFKFNRKENLMKPMGLPTKDFVREASELESLLKEKSLDNNFHYIDIGSEICDSVICSLTANGLYLYGDYAHFSDFGQAVIMKPIFKQYLKDLSVKYE
jgi:peptidoglycan/LPS O-acetylase OafA/YrhL